MNNPLGLIGIASLNVRAADTSVAQGINEIQSVALPTIVALAEGAVSASLMEVLEANESCVTLRTNLRALGFAGIGSELQATSKCIEVNEDELTFEIEIYCGDREICSGTLIRRVVDRLSLSAKIAALSVVDQSFENN